MPRSPQTLCTASANSFPQSDIFSPRQIAREMKSRRQDCGPEGHGEYNLLYKKELERSEKRAKIVQHYISFTPTYLLNGPSLT